MITELCYEEHEQVIDEKNILVITESWKPTKKCTSEKMKLSLEENSSYSYPLNFS